MPTPRLPPASARRAHGALRVLVALAGLTAGLPLPSRADDTGAAKALYQEGTKLYDVREYEAALQSFKKGYLAKPDAVFLFNIGQCYRKMGRWEEAVETYRNYLRKTPNASNRAVVEQLIVEAQDRLAGKAPRTAATPKVAPIGADPGPQGPPSPPAPPAPSKVTPGPAVMETPPPSPAGAEVPLVKRPLFWGLLGGGVALVAVGVTLGVVLGTPAQPTSPSLGSIQFGAP